MTFLSQPRLEYLGLKDSIGVWWWRAWYKSGEKIRFFSDEWQLAESQLSGGWGCLAST